MIIQNQSELEKFCLAAGAHPFITVDTEFLREKTYYSKLCLVQIGTLDGDAIAVDPLMDGIDLAPVFDLMKNTKLLKVFHAARQDLEIFYELMGEVVTPIFDTQIAAMVCGYGNSIGYNNLIQDLTGVQIDKSSQYTDWSRRPLSDKQINYALGDVTHLVHAYQKLFDELDRRGRTSWVFEEEKTLTDPATFQNPPQEAWRRVKIRSPKPKTLAVLREIAAWREEKAQRKNIPKSWVMRDETMIDMATQAPKNKKQLGRIRNIAKGLIESSGGEQLLELIKKAVESDPNTWPEGKKKKRVSASIAVKADILKMLLKIKCAEHDTAAKLVADGDDLQAIASGETDVPAMTGWRHEMFGQYADKLMNGALFIGMRDGQIVLEDVS